MLTWPRYVARARIDCPTCDRPVGVASLFARGDSGRRRLPMTPEDLLEAGVLVYLRGLGLFAPPEEPKQ